MAEHKAADAPRVRADYVRGDPAEDGPITRGQLELEPQGLHFSAPGHPDLRIELERLEGLTVSGRSPYERPRRHARGTMFVAARRNGDVDVWEFAVSRKAGATLRDSIHRELHARGLRRPPLPFVEQLVGPIESLHDDAPTAPAENGHPSEARRRLRLPRLRVILLGLLITAVVAAEIVLGLALLR
jgi:hypothetical protein